MPLKLHTRHFGSKFKTGLSTARKVQIASAWLTNSEALDALLRRNSCQVQAIIGIHGNATSPESLSSLAKRFGWHSLRLGGPQGPLFHPKLYIFYYARRRPVAWIGSANLTGHGMEVNKELMLQTDDDSLLAELGKWFDEEWRKAPPNTKERFDAYVADRRPPGRFEGDRGGVPEPEQHRVQAAKQMARVPPATTVRFQPTRGRAAGTYTGNVVAGSRREPYTSHTDALRAVLDVLRSGRPRFLAKCARHRAFRVVHHDDLGTSAYLAKDQSTIKEVRAGNGELTRQMQERIEKSGITPDPICRGVVALARHGTQSEHVENDPSRRGDGRRENQP